MRKFEGATVDLPTAALACTALQNICIVKGDSVSQKLDLNIDPTANENGCTQRVWKVSKVLKDKFWRERENIHER